MRVRLFGRGVRGRAGEFGDDLFDLGQLFLGAREYALELKPMPPAEFRQVITGPAARGDTEVVHQQGARVHEWHPEAAAIYQQMAVLARRLALHGHTTPDTPDPR